MAQRDLAARQKAIRPPKDPPVRHPDRSEVGGSGGGEVSYVVLRAMTPGAITGTFEHVADTDPASEIMTGTGETEELMLYPGATIDDYEPFVWEAEIGAGTPYLMVTQTGGVRRVMPWQMFEVFVPNDDVVTTDCRLE